MIDLTDRNALLKTLPHGGKVVEVGVERGKFSQVIFQQNQPKELYLVDAWRNQPGTEWQEKDPAAKVDHEANYAYVKQLFSINPNVRVIRSLSSDAANTFAGESLDIVYIDANHLNASADIESYWPKVKPGGWLCGHDYAMNEWITVKRDVDRFAKETGLPLLVTKEAYPSWAIRKPWPTTAPQEADIALVVTAYPPYADLLNETIPEIERHWPDHPPLVVGQDTMLDLSARMLADLRKVNSKFVVVMHEDFRLCGKVNQEQFDLCLKTMQADSSLISCSLTWEPSNIGRYHYKKIAYNDSFQVLPKEWDYTINFQMRIWRRELLMQLLASVPAGTTNAALEPFVTQQFRRMFSNHKAITYAFTDPKTPSTFVDQTDKTAWIVPYDNIIHAGRRVHDDGSRMPTQCPVYINNRNRLTSTRNMVEYLKLVPDALPIIVDNASTYPPLLEWYKTKPCEIVRYNRNCGPQAPWLLLGKMMRGCKYYVVTDSDLDLSSVPTDLLLVLKSGLERYPQNIKAGLSLEIDDLPSDLASTAIIREWEAKCWGERIDDQWWKADVDTTFAMYRAGVGWTAVSPAIRADRPYTARHIPWYRNNTEEERFFDEHCNPKWSTWSRWGSSNPAREKVLKAMQST